MSDHSFTHSGFTLPFSDPRCDRCGRRKSYHPIVSTSRAEESEVDWSSVPDGLPGSFDMVVRDLDGSTKPFNEWIAEGHEPVSQPTTTIGQYIDQQARDSISHPTPTPTTESHSHHDSSYTDSGSSHSFDSGGYSSDSGGSSGDSGGGGGGGDS